MSADELLKSTERSALKNNQFVSNVTGKNSNMSFGKKIKAWGAAAFIVAIVL